MIRVVAALLAALSCSAFADAHLTDGEVRRVDKAREKITLKHGEIRNLDMAPMTMVFGVKDKSLLDKLKAGDKVKFSADKDAQGQYVITGIEAQK